MPPRVRRAMAAACREAGAPHREAFGPKETRRRTPAAIRARRLAVAALYDPATAGRRSCGCEARWGIAAVGRALGLHHTTVLHAVRVLGLRP